MRARGTLALLREREGRLRGDLCFVPGGLQADAGHRSYKVREAPAHRGRLGGPHPDGVHLPVRQVHDPQPRHRPAGDPGLQEDRKSTRLNSSHSSISYAVLFFFNDTAPPEIYPLSLHDALPIWTEFTYLFVKFTIHNLDIDRQETLDFK